MAWHFKAILSYTMIMFFIYNIFLFPDKVWEFDNHVEWYQENQGKLGDMAKYYDCNAFGKLCLLTTNCVYLRQNLYKFGIHGKSLKYNINLSIYAGKNPNRFYAPRESHLHSEHEQTLFGIKYCESDEPGKFVNKKSQLVCPQIYVEGNPLNAVTV